MDADTGRRRIGSVHRPAQFEEERGEIMQAVEGVFRRGDFIGGAAVAKLEEELTTYLGSSHVVTLNSGTDALILVLDGARHRAR
jgi:dTDP-4-amino-4,6-dideoxygalactose transaminase